MLVRLGSLIFIFLKSGLYKKKREKKKNVVGAANSSRRCRLEAWSAHGWPSSWSGRRTDRVVPKLIKSPSPPKSPLIFMGMISWGFMVILVMKDRKFWGFRDDEFVRRSPWGLLLGHPIYY